VDEIRSYTEVACNGQINTAWARLAYRFSCYRPLVVTGTLSFIVSHACHRTGRKTSILYIRGNEM